MLVRTAQQLQLRNYGQTSRTTPHTSPKGWAGGDFREKWPRYIESALYVSVNWIITDSCDGSSFIQSKDNA